MEQILIALLKAAVRYKATDIHFRVEPDGHLSTEMRIGGTMVPLDLKSLDERFFRYLLYRADMDVSSTALPQTGSFEAEADGVRLALRFALVSGFHVQSGVLRILNMTSGLRISDLSMDPRQVRHLERITSRRSGLYLFSGPTGSGKTTTLYTILNETEGKKIYTLEDPVEVYSDRYIQLQVNESRHLSFAEGIRQLMRHDPDIIMIGEIRDSEAAAMAVRCALTGHLVLSTIHASSCTGALHRMEDLGVQAYQLEDILCGVSNQRLYEKQDGSGKTCIYEMMERKELMYYFRNHRTDPDFIPLGKAAEEAVRRGIISAQEAEADLC
ncbi:MAG: Flp pilus assembly complex ATPase component TadA [Solobacterium sp.]|nr:Flp pilus assembly complex ATPase component TadA [Solobacterium sp.]